MGRQTDDSELLISRHPILLKMTITLIPGLVSPRNGVRLLRFVAMIVTIQYNDDIFFLLFQI